MATPTKIDATIAMTAAAEIDLAETTGPANADETTLQLGDVNHQPAAKKPHRPSKSAHLAKITRMRRPLVPVLTAMAIPSMIASI